METTETENPGVVKTTVARVVRSVRRHPVSITLAAVAAAYVVYAVYVADETTDSDQETKTD